MSAFNDSGSGMPDPVSGQDARCPAAVPREERDALQAGAGFLAKNRDEWMKYSVQLEGQVESAEARVREYREALEKADHYIAELMKALKGVGGARHGEAGRAYHEARAAALSDMEDGT